jgi:hypothetical protein
MIDHTTSARQMTVQLDDQLAIDLLEDDRAPTSVADLVRHAQSLAVRAYVEVDPPSLREAEQILYRIHWSSNFHAPVDGAAHAVWWTLIRAKLRRLVAKAPTARPCSAVVLRAEFAGLIETLGTATHPLLDRIGREDSGGRAFRLWAKNWFASAHGFTRQLAGVALRCPPADQPALAKALADEFEGRAHFALRMQLLTHLGITYDDALTDPDYTTECIALLNLRCGLASWPAIDFALGAFLSIESNWQLECLRLCDILTALGITGVPAEVFEVHARKDVEHAEDWMRILGADHHTDEERGRALLGARLQLAARRQLYDAVDELASRPE